MKLVWVDQITGDPKKTTEFYASLFAADEVPYDEGNGYTSYSLKDRDGEEAFGIVEEAVFPDWAHGWVLYFEVDDLSACCDQIESRGGTIIRRSEKQCLFRDPAGAPVVVREGRNE